MSEAKSKTSISCRTCIDCQKMVGDGTSWRCYGSDKMGELKRDIRTAETPPRVSPVWCPHRAYPENQPKEQPKAEEMPLIVEGFGVYVGDGENISPVADKLAMQIEGKELKKIIGTTLDANGKQILSRRTISLLRRDLQIASKVEALSKLAQRDADQKWSDERLAVKEREWVEERSNLKAIANGTAGALMDAEARWAKGEAEWLEKAWITSGAAIQTYRRSEMEAHVADLKKKAGL